MGIQNEEAFLHGIHNSAFQWIGNTIQKYMYELPKNAKTLLIFNSAFSFKSLLKP